MDSALGTESGPDDGANSRLIRMMQDKVSAMALVDSVLWLFRVVRVDILLICFLLYKFHRRIYIFFKCLRRDLIFMRRLQKVFKVAKTFEAEDETVYSAFDKLVVSHPNDVCFFSEDKNWTYRDVKDFADRLAQVASADGFKKGDTIALVMGNRPEYLCVRLGLAQLGVITALVNANLRDRPLEHTIEIVSTKGIIVESDFAPVIHEIRSAGRLSGVVKVYQFEGDLLPDSVDLKARMTAAPPGRPEVNDPPHHHDTALYVYSSGTTGLPKACILPHSRIIMGPVGVKVFFSLTPGKDVVYTSLPLYHLAGGGFGVGLALVTGVPVAIARKFSASRFWSDCIKFNATTAQYIGEMCRFMITQPPQPTDRAHKVRLMFGNGLRTALWKPFQERFNVPTIVEVYGSTEGNSTLFNATDNVVGVVGFVPRILPRSFFPIAVVRVDQETEELIRGPDGFCQRCNIGEPGIFIGLISKDVPGRSFEGYIDREATEKKIVRNVFKRGDQWFNSGDLMEMDEFGYFSFKDRCGDTYRWKGENVATGEIENIMKSALPERGIAVYGVQIPETEGRCGMAAIEDLDGTADQATLDTLADGLKRSVAVYARPLFVRIMKKIPVNGAYKFLKNVLQKEGYDPTKLSDPIYFLDPKTVRYVRLTETMFNDLNSGRIRV